VTVVTLNHPYFHVFDFPLYLWNARARVFKFVQMSDGLQQVLSLDEKLHQITVVKVTPIASLLNWDFSYSYAAVDNILADITHRAVSLP